MAVRPGPFALLGLLLGCGAPMPRTTVTPEAVGCYVIQRRTHTTSDSLELLFPYFFGLARRGDDPAARVLLPRNELIGRAGHWSWTEGDGWVTVTVHTDAEGFQLDLQNHSQSWNGRLHAWGEGQSGDWLVAGARVDCDEGLVAAAE